MTSRINNNSRSATLPCIECGRMLRFRIVNEVVVGSEGRIVANVPCAVCPDCVESLLDRMVDPPGLICIDRLSPELAQGLLKIFAFLLPRLEALEFFKRLFPEI
jgi:YgiT-type zinc finger domain-containing protein